MTMREKTRRFIFSWSQTKGCTKDYSQLSKNYQMEY